MVPTEAAYRDTVAALLRIQADLERTLLQPPETEGERGVWRDAVSALLLESARGRVFLSGLQLELGDRSEPERLAG